MYLQQREDTEWTNCWWSKANKKIDRILLVGDSVIRRIRGNLEKFLLGQYAVDLFATSLSLDDYLFWKHLELFLNTNEYEYECIIVQCGFHHGFNRRCADVESDYIDFQDQYYRLLKLLKQYSSNIVLSTGNSEMFESQTEKLNEIREKEIVCRNSIIKKLAEEQEHEVFDMYSVMHGVDNEYKYEDAQHFERGADIFIAYSLANLLINSEIIRLEDVKKDLYTNMYNKLLGNNEIIIIYGSARYAKEMYWIFKFYLPQIKVIRFVESYMEKEKWCLGNKVTEIDDISVYEKNKAVLVISSIFHYKEMKQNAEKLEFKKICTYNDVINLFNQI